MSDTWSQTQHKTNLYRAALGFKVLEIPPQFMDLEAEAARLKKELDEYKKRGDEEGAAQSEQSLRTVQLRLKEAIDSYYIEMKTL